MDWHVPNVKINLSPLEFKKIIEYIKSNFSKLKKQNF